MNRYTIPLGRLYGIPVGLDPSWFLIFILITWTLATSYFPTEYRAAAQAGYWLLGAVTAILLFASVLLHELGHSLVALRYRIPVRKITLYIFGGVAQISAEPPNPSAEFWIALAGPAVSLALAGIFWGLRQVSTEWAPVLALAKYLSLINASLAVFNLVPGFPLDGGRVFRAFIWRLTHNLRRATLVAAAVGRSIAYIFILLGVWQMLTGNLSNGLWIAFIGWFLENAASSQTQQQAVLDLLGGHTVEQAMEHNCPFIPRSINLQELVDQHVLGSGQRCFIVVDEVGRPSGMLSLQHIKQIPRTAWADTRAGQAMLPIQAVKWIQPETAIKTALTEMDQAEVNQLPVMDRSGQVVGLLTREGIVNFMRMQQELGL